MVWTTSRMQKLPVSRVTAYTVLVSMSKHVEIHSYCSHVMKPSWYNVCGMASIVHVTKVMYPIAFMEKRSYSVVALRVASLMTLPTPRKTMSKQAAEKTRLGYLIKGTSEYVLLPWDQCTDRSAAARQARGKRLGHSKIPVEHAADEHGFVPRNTSDGILPALDCGGIWACANAWLYVWVEVWRSITCTRGSDGTFYRHNHTKRLVLRVAACVDRENHHDRGRHPLEVPASNGVAAVAAVAAAPVHCE
jgi:hypothetical protein